MLNDVNHSDDLQLVKRVLEKDREAFDSFFDTYFRRLYRFCRARLSESEACEDIVQETLIKAIQNLAGYRGEASLFSWLCQICRNEMSNWYQRHGRKSEPLVSLDDDPHISSALESLYAPGMVDESERLAIEKMVQLTLDYLPDKYSKVLEYMYLEGLTVKEIAAQLGMGVIAVQSLLARARTAFRRGFRDLQHEIGQQQLSTKS